MTSPALESPRRLAIAAIPILGFLSTPFLPFVNGPHLWFGVPSVLVWTAIWVIGTVVALRIVEATYQRDGGGALDAADASDDPLHPATDTTPGDAR